MSALDQILGILKDPPPEFVFEIAADGIAVSRTRPPATVQQAVLRPGILAPSPVKENILDAAAFSEAVRRLIPPVGSGRRTAALVLPDNCVRIAVLDFDTLPEKDEDRRALIGLRLRKSVPFDIDEAAISWHEAAPNRLVVVLAPLEVIAHYEAPFRAAGLNPGLVTVSSLATLELLPRTGSFLLARRAPGTLTVLVVKDGAVTIARSLELNDEGDDVVGEISSDIYPAMTYAEDQTGARPDKLYLAGFTADAAARLSIELDIPAEMLPQANPGLSGYLAALNSRINLASVPFRRDRPILVASAAAATLLAATLILLIYLAVSDRRQAEVDSVALQKTHNEMTGVQREQARVDSVMRQTGNAAALDRSVLINALIQRKGISWTRIFADLETVLPHNVRIIAIRPQVNSRNELSLDMTVAADTPEQVIGFITNLEGSDVFGSTAVSGYTPPTQTDATWRYRLTVNYAQKL